MSKPATFEPGNTVDAVIGPYWGYDIKNRKQPRSYHWPEYFEQAAYVGQEYKRVVCRVTETMRDIPKDSDSREVKAVVMSDDEVMATDFKQHYVTGWHYQSLQADLFKANGYEGPIPGGTARGLANAFNALGKPESVRRGYFDVVKSYPNHWRSQYGNGGVYTQSRRTHCYVFKSPRPEVSLKDFIRLARAYRSGKGLREAIKQVIEADGSDFKQTLETLTTLDTLAGLGE